MWEDLIVKEVREARLEIEQECANDFHKIYERALEIQKKVADKKVFRQMVKKQEEKVPLTV
jgi:hypothetical protein